MNIRVLSLSAAGADGIRVCFELCCGENSERRALVISADAFTRLKISKGECTSELYDTVESEARIYSAYNRGLYILGYGACSKNMLISKLIAKGEDRSASVEAVERIEERGFMDECESARREAEICARKLWGERRIRASLQQKKYRSDAIDKALFALEDAGVDFDESCKNAIRQKYKALPTDRQEMQKLIAAICRLGYSAPQVQSACRDLRDEYRLKWIYS